MHTSTAQLPFSVFEKKKQSTRLLEAREKVSVESPSEFTSRHYDQTLTYTNPRRSLKLIPQSQTLTPAIDAKSKPTFVNN